MGNGLDLSQWIRGHLRSRLIDGAADFTYLVPDGLPTEPLAIEGGQVMLSEMIDALLAHGAALGARPHIEFTQDRGARDSRVLIIRTEGCTPSPDLMRCVADWDRRAHRLGAAVQLKPAPDAGLALYLTTPIAAGRGEEPDQK